MKNKSPLRIFLGNTYYLSVGACRKIWLSVTFYFYNGFITHFPSYRIRTFYLRSVLGITIGRYTAIHTGCYFSGSNIIIGNNTVIGRKSYLDGRVGLITIKDNVSIAPEAYILSLTHDKDSPVFATVAKPVTIENNCWLGARVLILPGVLLNKGCVVGAGAVVTKSVDEYIVVAGNPAAPIGTRAKDLSYTLKYFPLFNTDI
jgi:acetyltransferase-like isoleucine patch superfamily enzyme